MTTSNTFHEKKTEKNSIAKKTNIPNQYFSKLCKKKTIITNELRFCLLTDILYIKSCWASKISHSLMKFIKNSVCIFRRFHFDLNVNNVVDRLIIRIF